jgi:hypothetical protein
VDVGSHKAGGEAVVVHADRLVGPLFLCVNAIVEYVGAGAPAAGEAVGDDVGE